MTVLVVDDAPANIQIVHAILKDDYKVRVATSGAKALELMKLKPFPDLVLLDVVMPDMDGYEVCRVLKATAEARDIPVIFLTGKTEADDETKGFGFGSRRLYSQAFLGRSRESPGPHAPNAPRSPRTTLAAAYFQ